MVITAMYYFWTNGVRAIALSTLDDGGPSFILTQKLSHSGWQGYINVSFINWDSQIMWIIKPFGIFSQGLPRTS